VRSGTRPFGDPDAEQDLEIVEKVSHAIVSVALPADAFAEPADYVVFTSVTTVQRLFAEEGVKASLARALGEGQVVAVGNATAANLRERGVTPAIVAAGSGEAILSRLPSDLDGRRILLPCGEDAATRLPDALVARGARVTRLDVYRKIPTPAEPDLDREILKRPFAAFCATSPAAASWLFLGRTEPAAQRLRETPGVVLGPSTRRFLEAQQVARICTTHEPRFPAAAALLGLLATAPGRK
jgi:uroporphyrinogen-III synthase